MHIDASPFIIGKKGMHLKCRDCLAINFKGKQGYHFYTPPHGKGECVFSLAVPVSVRQ